MDDLVESGRAFQSLMRKGRKIGEGGCSIRGLVENYGRNIEYNNVLQHNSTVILL